MENQLQNLGLSKNETKIYLFLLKIGPITTGKIIKETQIANSRVYESLNSLINKGLVTYNIQKDGKHFQAESPKKFLEIEEEKKKQIQNLLPSLLNLQSKEEKETTSAVYEGLQGFKTAFENVIENCPRNETIYILGFSDEQYKIESLRTFLKNMNLKSAQKRQKLKVILDISVKNTLGKDREEEKFTEVRYMPKDYTSPVGMDIFGDYIYMFLWGEKPFVFMIKNQKLAHDFKQYFNFLWKIAKT